MRANSQDITTALGLTRLATVAVVRRTEGSFTVIRRARMGKGIGAKIVRMKRLNCIGSITMIGQKLSVVGGQKVNEDLTTYLNQKENPYSVNIVGQVLGLKFPFVTNAGRHSKDQSLRISSLEHPPITNTAPGQVKYVIFVRRSRTGTVSTHSLELKMVRWGNANLARRRGYSGGSMIRDR